MNKNKRLAIRLLRLILAIVILLVCYAIFNILVDPFGVFGDPLLHWYGYNETSNPGVAKVAWLDQHHEQYDSYIIGSLAASYNVDELNAYLYASFYNLCIDNCDTKYYKDLAIYVMDRYTVKNIVLNLGVEEPIHYDEKDESLYSKYTRKHLATV